jgi:hypothetical protein
VFALGWSVLAVGSLGAGLADSVGVEIASRAVQGAGYGAFAGGAALLPMTITIMVLMVAIAPRVIARFGPKVPIVAGMLLLAAGIAVLSLVRPDGNFVVDVLPASLLAAPRASSTRATRSAPRSAWPR